MPSLLVIQKLAKALETTMASLMGELESGTQGGQQEGGPEKKARRPTDSHSAPKLVKVAKKKRT